MLVNMLYYNELHSENPRWGLLAHFLLRIGQILRFDYDAKIYFSIVGGFVASPGVR